MRKILLILAILFGIFLIYKFSQFKGALPAVLPPKDLPKAKSVPNDLGLNLPPGFSIEIFAEDLKSPRVLAIDPVGTLIASIPAEGKIVALPDKDKRGKSDQIIILKDGLDKPHGLAFKDGKLYVAQLQSIVSFDYDQKNLKLSNEKHIADLPGGGRHNTRTIGFGGDGKLYVSVGSTCDVCVEKDTRNGTILQVDVEKGESRIFAKGLRNSVFFAFNPNDHKIWATEMGRDFLGDNLPPDEVNIIEDGGDYGWPFCYGDKVADGKFSKNADCQSTRSPIYKICAHCAPLGIAFIKSSKFPQSWQGDLLVSYHGSWNSSVPVGYKVVRIKVDGERTGREEDFIAGFLGGNQTKGRPVDLVFDGDGNLFLSDDKAGVIYKVSYQN